MHYSSRCMKSQLTTSRTELWILRNVLFPHQIDHIFAKNEKWKKDKTLQRCFKMTNHCTWAVMLKPLHQYVGETRWKYTAKGRNPSANICLIIGSTRRVEPDLSVTRRQRVSRLSSRGSLQVWLMTQTANLTEPLSSADLWSVFISPKSESDPSWKQRRRLPCNHLKKHGASEGCHVCIWKSGRLPRENEVNFVPFISNLVQLFDMEMFEVSVQLVLKALSGSLTDKPWEHKGVNEMGNWG